MYLFRRAETSSMTFFSLTEVFDLLGFSLCSKKGLHRNTHTHTQRDPAKGADPPPTAKATLKIPRVLPSKSKSTHRNKQSRFFFGKTKHFCISVYFYVYSKQVGFSRVLLNPCCFEISAEPNLRYTTILARVLST